MGHSVPPGNSELTRCGPRLVGNPRYQVTGEFIALRHITHDEHAETGISDSREPAGAHGGGGMLTVRSRTGSGPGFRTQLPGAGASVAARPNRPSIASKSADPPRSSRRRRPVTPPPLA